MRGLKKFLSIDDNSLRKEYKSELKKELRINQYKNDILG